MKDTRGNKFSRGNIKIYGEYGRHGHSDIVREKKFCEDTQIAPEIIGVCMERGFLNSIKLLSGYNGEERETYLKVDVKMEKLLDYFCISRQFEWQPERIIKHFRSGPGELFSVNGFQNFLQTIARAEKDEPGVSITELSIFLGCSNMQMRTFIRQGIINAGELEGSRKKNEKYVFYKIKTDDNLRALLMSVGAMNLDDDLDDVELVQKIISGALIKGMPEIKLSDAA